MKLIGDIGARLSQEKFRKYYLMTFFLLIVVMLIPFLPEKIRFGLKYDVSNILDYVELIFVLVTLIYLYMSTSKEELNRYKENYKFYEKRYEGESLLILDVDDKIVHSSSINYDNIDISSVKSLNQIGFNLAEGEYTLPLLIEECARDILVKKFNIQSKTDYNGLTLSLKNINMLPDGGMEMVFHQSCYYNYLLTNMIPEYEILSGLTVRDYLEASGKKILNDLNVSLAENHLGISCLVTIPVAEGGEISNYLIIPKRSMNITVFKGQLAPSISGAANIDTCSKNEKLSIVNFFSQEMDEELSPFLKDIYDASTYDKFKSDFLEDSILIGASRELKRLGKPELFFYFEFGSAFDIDKLQSSDEFKVIVRDDYYEISGSKDKSKNIDLSECDSYFLIKPSVFIEELQEYVKENSRSRSSFNKEEIYTVFTNDNIKVSESLLVNAIYAKKYF